MTEPLTLDFYVFNIALLSLVTYFFKGIKLGRRVPSNVASNARPNKRQRCAGPVREDAVAVSPVLFEQSTKVMGDLTSEVSEILKSMFFGHHQNI